MIHYLKLRLKIENHDLKFYYVEINIREKFNYPPFCDIIIGVLSGNDEEAVKADSTLFHDIFAKHFKTFKPMPAPIAKINGDSRWRVIMKEKLDEEKRTQMRECLNEFLSTHNTKVKLNFDINPNNMN